MENFQGIKLTNKCPQIITLCGSSRFCAQMAVLAWELEKGGAITLGLHLLPMDYCEYKGMTPDEDGKIHHIGEQEGVEDQMDALHFKKIEMSDKIFVVNVGGYIGSSTRREIEYAAYLGKPINYLVDIMSEYKQYKRKGLSEMRPYVPGEDLTGISVSATDTPEEGDFVARNPKNYDDKWLVKKAYHEDNLELADLSEATTTNG